MKRRTNPKFKPSQAPEVTKQKLENSSVSDPDPNHHAKIVIKTLIPTIL
jgi:hypothetical protein